jgi:hypothetical protein
MYNRHSSDELDEAYLENLLVEKGIPTKDDLQSLIAQINSLSDKLDEIRDENEP